MASSRAACSLACLLAGASAALAAVLAKLAGGPELALLLRLHSEELEGHDLVCCAMRVILVADPQLQVLPALRALCYFGMVACNVVMWSLCMIGLRVLPTLQANVQNLAANLVCSGIFGFLLFGEALSIRWLAGITCILCGVVVLAEASREEEAGPREVATASAIKLD
eukprot:SM000258S09085  [mRNA]  locus=s258:17387:18346:+ [translate_table: standard]